ncbi:unnamed protein product [Cylindrotheca closterium]|uniref:Xylose isomerase-like TIM barrel domain-containing protein n=1 Tax=Cylindrotheca closterium TaxID=2856 RepID=A0AAD2JLF0_9STRA|nr:unnamed protein product [Cylindrotheca closterium]
MTKQPELKLIKTLWGIDDPLSPELLKSIKEEGYHGIEVIRLAWTFDKDLLVKSLNESGLAVVCQIHTSGGYLKDDEYIYCGAYDVASHQEDLKKQLLECKELIDIVNVGGFINIHGGLDAWSKSEALEFLEFSLKEIEQTVPETMVTFETHRQRLFGSPFQTRDLLSSPSLAKLKLNADLSHWYCACERVFNPNEDRDKIWWPELIKTICGHCEYIHARFGWAQGPQMSDPSAKECDVERTLQLQVWKQLMQEQLNRNPSPVSIYASPEFGPPPYMPVKPHSQEPVASLPDAVSYTKKALEELFVTL